MHEFYDEVVFTNPKESFHRQLMRTSVLPRIKSHEPAVQENFPTYTAEEDLKALLEAQTFLEAEIGNAKSRLLQADQEVVQIEDELAELAQTKEEGNATLASRSVTNSASLGSGKGIGSGGKNKSAGGGQSSKKAKTTH